MPRPSRRAASPSSSASAATRRSSPTSETASRGRPRACSGALEEVSPDLRAIVARGELGFAWQTLRGDPVLIVGGRQDGPPELYFVFPARAVEEALAQLRIGLVGAGLVAILLALLTSRLIARGILRPVAASGRAARRIADGDLSARVPGGGRDEFGRLAADFNRMADSLQASVGRLEEAQTQNRRFVADVAHELRTPLTALVAEASLIEGSLAQMTPDARRAAQLLVADVRRLRALVDDLMEISRFDADAERAAVQGVDLGRIVTAVVAARLPEATVTLPVQPVVVETDPRRLDRILGNLLDNARAHAPGAAVEVSLTPTSDGAVIVVADRGPGVLPTRCPTCSTGSSRPIRPVPPAARAWVWRSPPSTRRCSAAASARETGRAVGSSSR